MSDGLKKKRITWYFYIKLFKEVLTTEPVFFKQREVYFSTHISTLWICLIPYI